MRRFDPKKIKATCWNSFTLLHVSQWYKNCLVFLGLIFDKQFFNFYNILASILGFFLASLISSSNYIINDIVDRKEDAQNNIKKSLLSSPGTLKIGYILAIVLALASFVFSYILSPLFFIFIVLMSIFGQIYNFLARKLYLVDIIILIAIYLFRAYSGCYLVHAVPNFLTIIPLVCLTLFLIFIKKRSIILTLGEEKAVSFRKNYAVYTLKRTDIIVKVLGVMLAILYFFYLLFNEKFNKAILYITYPLALFLIYLVSSITARKPDTGIFLWKVFKVKQVFLSSIAIVILYAIAFL